MVPKRFLRFIDSDGNLIYDRLIKIAGTNIITLINIIENHGNDIKQCLLQIASSSSYDYIRTIIRWGEEMEDDEVQTLLANANDPLILETIKLACCSFALEVKKAVETPSCLSVREFLERADIKKKEPMLADYFFSVKTKDKDNETTGIMRNDFTWNSVVGMKAWDSLLNKTAFDGFVEFAVHDEDDIIKIDLNDLNEIGHSIVFPGPNQAEESYSIVKNFINSYRQKEAK